jgi:phosphatidylserine decarboxylase
MTLSETLNTVIAPPHPAGKPFILCGALVALVGLFIGAWMFWLGLLFLFFCLYFFRDPERVAPGREGAVLAPADGHVAIFLSVLDVHVNRVPYDGVVTRIAYRHGTFVNASLDKASEVNERNALAIQLADGRTMAVVQIAGLIARRIVCGVREGDPVRAGERFGIIRFGSRTDLYLPEGVVPLVSEGQTMIGGETVVADLGRHEPALQNVGADEMGLA